MFFPPCPIIISSDSSVFCLSLFLPITPLLPSHPLSLSSTSPCSHTHMPPPLHILKRLTLILDTAKLKDKYAGEGSVVFFLSFFFFLSLIVTIKMTTARPGSSIIVF